MIIDRLLSVQPQTQDSVCIYTVYSAEGLVPSSSKRMRNCAKYGNANVLSLVACQIYRRMHVDGEGYD